MLTGQRILYEAAEKWTLEWAEEMRRNYKNSTGSIDGLLIFSRARVATIMEILEAIAMLDDARKS